jgi:hypothetical protein
MVLLMAEKNLKVSIDGELKDVFDSICAARRISMKDAIEGMIRAMKALEKHETAQAVLLGQLTPTPGLMKYTLQQFGRESVRPQPRRALSASESDSEAKLTIKDWQRETANRGR